jgi:hypothetical protein
MTKQPYQPKTKRLAKRKPKVYARRTVFGFYLVNEDGHTVRASGELSFQPYCYSGPIEGSGYSEYKGTPTTEAE